MVILRECPDWSINHKILQSLSICRQTTKELRESLNIDRNTMNKAMQRLAMLGMVEAKSNNVNNNGYIWGITELFKTINKGLK